MSAAMHQQVSHETKHPFFTTKFSTSSLYLTLFILFSPFISLSLKKTMREREKKTEQKNLKNSNLQDKVSGKRNSKNNLKA
ncbi:hypothetical protein BDV35DRAFT_367604 [Aspergillus flavus]|uniref:Uncharacterized protein n=1 Tax=Aspergillus flavus TaxID=5059 RepID=A0A5N6GJ66_ASPFL|nr:hypothetical protein BDV35DRAFT_367604 [Aspergillus flavus]